MAGPNETLMSVTVFERTALPELRAEGFDVPSYRSLQSTLTAGLEPLVVEQRTSYRGPHPVVCSFCNFLNLLWGPVLKHIENLTTNPSLRRTMGLEMNT